MVARDALGVLEPLRGLDDDELVGFDRDAVRVKIIFLASAAEADSLLSKGFLQFNGEAAQRGPDADVIGAFIAVVLQ